MDGRRSVRGNGRGKERKGSDSGCTRRRTSQFDLSARRLSLSLSLSFSLFRLARVATSSLARIQISRGKRTPARETICHSTSSTNASGLSFPRTFKLRPYRAFARMIFKDLDITRWSSSEWMLYFAYILRYILKLILQIFRVQIFYFFLFFHT